MTTEPTDPIPRTFEEWRYCIEHWCGIELSPQYIEQRLAAMQNTNDEHTRRFIESYGQAHHEAVLSWFRRAQQEISRT